MFESVALLKWAAQVLLFASGVWALLGAETFRVDPLSGGRRLTLNGWTKILMLLTGFALFIATDLQERRRSRVALLQAEQQSREQARQLDYLRRLFLLQFEVAGLDFEWELDAATRAMLERELASPEAAAVRDALLAGKLETRRAGGERWSLHVDVERGGERFARGFEQGGPEWNALERALLALFAGARVELAGGELLAEPLGRHWPCRFTASEGRLGFSLERPGVALGAFEDAQLVVVGGAGVARLPRALSVRSTDPKLALEQRLELDWSSEERERWVDGAGEHVVTRQRSAALPLSASFVADLGSR